ncbi:MAG: hypothetical protein KME06_02210 [Kastovskya adunca ATA6-11-RM4]|jgi:hypothetical protein|nr:hypothetical protein [Kastovskya adunca ATA6-11-RM4]
MNSNDSVGDLSYYGTYPCPVCRLGQIEPMTLMDAMSCQLCHHIFTANLEKQQLQMADRQPPLMWRWNGKAWTKAQVQGLEWNSGYWLVAAVFVLLPTTLVGLSAYAFPPLPGSPLSWFPQVWTGLAFVSHLALVVWLVLEFYQVSVGTHLRVRGQNLFGR